MNNITNNITYNIDKLPLEAVGMIHFLFKGIIEGFEDVYMVEVKLDDPLKHIKEENENFIVHKDINQYQRNAKHAWDKDWAVLHKSIFFEKITDIDENRFKILLIEYFKKEDELNKKVKKITKKKIKKEDKK